MEAKGTRCIKEEIKEESGKKITKMTEKRQLAMKWWQRRGRVGIKIRGTKKRKQKGRNEEENENKSRIRQNKKGMEKQRKTRRKWDEGKGKGKKKQ